MLRAVLRVLLSQLSVFNRRYRLIGDGYLRTTSPFHCMIKAVNSADDSSGGNIKGGKYRRRSMSIPLSQVLLGAISLMLSRL